MKLYEYVDKAITHYAASYGSPYKKHDERFEDALVDVIEVIKDCSIGELKLLPEPEDDFSDLDDEE